MFDAKLHKQAATLIAAYRAAGKMLACAESCTGGLLSGLLTEIAGSSAVLERGFITYSNRAKTEMLGVDAALIDRVGAVSAEVAGAMATGVLAKSPADVAVSITGVAGPGGGTAQKPVGLVHFACAVRNGGIVLREMRFGDLGRAKVREAALGEAMAMLDAALPHARP